jgi:hypothetical protein
MCLLLFRDMPSFFPVSLLLDQLIFAAVARLYTASPRQRDWRFKQWGIAAIVVSRASVLPVKPHFIRLYHHKVCSYWFSTAVSNSE